MKAGKIASALILMLGIAVLLFYFYTTESGVEIKTIDICKKTCDGELAKGTNLTDGPCLLNPMPTYSNWVCDVSHWPRQPVDANETNQCSEYGRTANHFVEVFPNCSFIRAV